MTGFQPVLDATIGRTGCKPVILSSVGGCDRDVADAEFVFGLAVSGRTGVEKRETVAGAVAWFFQNTEGVVAFVELAAKNKLDAGRRAEVVERKVEAVGGVIEKDVVITAVAFVREVDVDFGVRGEFKTVERDEQGVRAVNAVIPTQPARSKTPRVAVFRVRDFPKVVFFGVEVFEKNNVAGKC